MPTNKSTTADINVNSEGVLYVMLDVDLTITAVSRLFISVFGNGTNSFAGKSLTQFTFFENQEKWISSIRYCLSNPGVAVNVEVDTTPGESVKTKHFQWNILSLADAGNNQNGIFCLGKEIMEDKKNKTDLPLKKGLPEHVLQEYIHSTHEGLFIFDQNYCVTLANQAAVIISTGVTNKIVHTGDDIMTIIPVRRRKKVLQILEHVFRGETIEYEMCYNYINDRKPKWLFVSVSPIYNQNGEIDFVNASLRDITKEKQLQEQLNEKEKQKQKEIVAAVIAAQEKDRQTIAYELHENVSQLLSMSKMMLGVYPSKDPMSIDYSKQANEVIGKAINEMRRISDSIDPSNVKIVGLPSAVEDLANGIRKSQDLQIQINISKYNKNVAHNPDIELAVFRIIQEWLNTIIRQGKATVAVIELAGMGPQILLTIRDNGVGIDLASILEGPDTRNIFNRSELYDGKLNIHNESGTGCTLKLIIPAK